MLAFAVRHFLRHWQINLVVLAGLVLGATLLSALPIYAERIAGESLAQSLDAAFASVRNLKVAGAPPTRLDWVQGAEESLRAGLGDLVLGRLVIRERTLDAERTVYVPQASGGGAVQRPVGEMLYLHFWSFGDAHTAPSEYVRLLSGQWPGVPRVQETLSGASDLVVEAAIGADAAAAMDLGLGDELWRCSDIHPEGCFWVRITGIVAPVDPYHDVWWSDPDLPAFSVKRVPSMSRVDDLYLSLIVAPEAIAGQMPGHTLSWRVLLDWPSITSERASVVREQLINLEARLSADSAAASTGLVKLIEQYQRQRRLAQGMLLLLTAQSLLAVLYSLSTISAFVLERSQHELATLSGRGFSDEQIGLLFGLEVAVLALGLAFPLGPVLARLLLVSWSGSGIPRESWLLSLAAALFGWLTLVVSLYLSLRRREGRGLASRARSVPSSLGQGWQRLAFEALLLVLGGLAYWQLLRAGTFVRSEGAGAGGADPVLLLGPTLLFVALGFAVLRIVRPLLRWGAWAASGVRGLVLPLGLRRLARESRSSGGWSISERVLLLVSLSTAMVVFSAVSRASISFSQQERAQVSAGADLRLGLSLGVNVRDKRAQVEGLPGVVSASPVCRVQSRWGRFEGRNVNFVDVRLVAVEPETWGQVAHWTGPAGAMVETLRPPAGAVGDGDAVVLPALLSPDAPPRGVKVGDRVHYLLGPQRLEFEVLGFVEQFPTLERPFVLTDLTALQDQIVLDELLVSSLAGCEWWLDVAPEQHEGLVQMLQQQARISDLDRRPVYRVIDDAQARLRAFQSDLVVRTAVAALGLNALALALLSISSYLMTLLLTVRRRWVEFGVLHAVGVAGRQTLVLLSLESAIVVGLGLLAGAGLGYGLAHAMRAFVALVLAASLGEGALAGLVVDWPALLRLGAALVGGYGLALGILLFVVVRGKVHRALRLPEE